MNKTASAVLRAIALHRLTEEFFKFETVIRFHGRSETSFTPKRKVRPSQHRFQRNSKMPNRIVCGHHIQNFTHIGKKCKKKKNGYKIRNIPKESLAFTAPIFTKLKITKQIFVSISCNEVFKSRNRTVVNNSTVSFKTFSTVFFPLPQL